MMILFANDREGAAIMELQIKKIRKLQKMTQQQLAALSGVSQSKICEYERGKVMPGLEAADKIARALRCTLDDLVHPKSEVAS